MKKLFCFMLSVLCLFSLFGCSNVKENDALNTLPTDVYDIEDFKCVCSIDGETEFVIEADEAKQLYSFVMEQWGQADQTNIDSLEKEYVYIQFQDGEPFVLSQQAKTEVADTPAESVEQFYGVFWILESDFMVYTAAPMTSFQAYYKLPDGTYDKVTEMVNMN